MPGIKRLTPTAVAKPRVHSASDPWGATTYLRMLMYGESGTGKTTCAATFPDPIRWLICSGGMQPGELKSIDTPENRERIHPLIVNSTEQYLADLADAHSNPGKYATFVLDHASGFADVVLKEIMGLEDILTAKYRVAGKGESWSVVSKQQYGQMAIKCKEMFRALLNLPCNIIILAHQRTFGGSDDEATVTSDDLIKPTVGAALSPSVTNWLNGAVDYLVQTFKRPKQRQSKMTGSTGKEVIMTVREKGIDYCLRTEAHDTYQTKFRVPMREGFELPPFIINPTYEKVAKVINGEEP